MGAPASATSVVVSTYDEKRWDDLAACMGAIAQQTRPPLETIVVVDHNEPLLERTRAAFPSAKVIANARPRGLAGARNSGIDAAAGELVAFVDDDARAEPDWLAELEPCFADEHVVGAGGALLPSWEGSAPDWFPDEFLWVVGCSYTGLPKTPAPVRNPIGANMAVRAAVLREVGGFREGGGEGAADAPSEIHSRGVVRAAGNIPDDTDLAIRVRQRHPAGTWLYQPRARVQHSVPGERAALGYFVRRCFEEGVGKANLSRYVGSEEGLASERAYVARVLPRGVAHAVHQALRGDPAGAARAGAIVLGLLVTGAGFSLTSAKNALSGSKPEHRQMTRRKRPEPPSPEFSPVRVHDIEIGEPLAPLLPGRTGSGQPFGSCLCLIRLHGRPLGTIEVPLPAAGVPAERLAELVQTALGDRIVDHLHADGLEPQPLGVAGLPGPETPPCVAVRERMLADPPRISVVIVTRGRPQRVLRTMLSILSCRYPRDRCEVIIVDTPEDGQPPLDFSAEPSIPADANVRVVVEPQRGISLGRNRGLREATGEIVVFADDDVDVDANWLPNLIAGFELGDRVAAVSGPTLPATIETPTERWFEGFGGLQRGYETRVYSLDHRPAEQPLFPFVPGALGSGRSMAFRREAFLRLGGFDPALGPPTPTLAGEDIEALLRFVLLGRQVVHEPAALVWHAHPRDYAMLRRRMWGYGLGLSACITKSVVAEPKLLPLLVRKLPRGIAFAVSPHSEKNRRRQGDYPRELVRLEAAGLLVGPLAYARSRIQRRRRGGAPDAVRG